MTYIFQLFIVILAGIAVGIADALIKKMAITGGFLSALKNPLILVTLLLYIAQIALVLYVFMHKWDLGIVGVIQTVFYSMTVVTLGLFVFSEVISLT